MATIQKSLRIPQDVAAAIEAMAQTTRRDFSSVANEILAEAVKMQRCPGIIFAESPSGRRARIAGTGLDVWEVIATYKSLDEDRERLHWAYHWLSTLQLKAALGYYTAYAAEIDGWISRNKSWDLERLAQQHPSLAPSDG